MLSFNEGRRKSFGKICTTNDYEEEENSQVLSCWCSRKSLFGVGRIGNYGTYLEFLWEQIAALPMRWHGIDPAGNTLQLEVDKYFIMRRVGIKSRDFRIIDSLLIYPATIVTHENAIIMNLEHLKLIVTKNEVLIRDDDLIRPILEKFRQRLLVNGSPFALRALEVALEVICDFLDAQSTILHFRANSTLRELTTKTSSQNLYRERELKSEITSLTTRVQRVTVVRDELERLLTDNDEMGRLHLSRVLVGPSTSSGHADVVEKIEMLLEAYSMRIDGTLQVLTQLREYVKDTEALINIQLDNRRNQLIQLELSMNAFIILSISICSLVAGILGMNIAFPWADDHGDLFTWGVQKGNKGRWLIKGLQDAREWLQNLLLFVPTARS